MGKLEEQHPSLKASEHYTPWHGHITVLTVAPAWRRLGHARRLTERLERGSDINNAWFVDLYVRAGNKVAVDMYKGMGCVEFPSLLFFASLRNMYLLTVWTGTPCSGAWSIIIATIQQVCRKRARMRSICASRVVGIRN
jgi:GNAT superfamily N-acetyltransferase